MTVEELVKEVMSLPLEERATFHKQLEIYELIEGNLKRTPSARINVDNEKYGKFEGTFHFGPMWREVCRHFQQKAFPQDPTGKKVNDGPTIIATGDGVGGFVSQRIDGPVDGGALSAFELIAFNMLSDSKQYEDFFQNALERLAALVEDRVISMFEGKKYLGPDHFKQRILHYVESPTERRNNTWRPPLKNNQKFSPGRHSKRAEFELNLEAARQRLRNKESKITQENMFEEMGYDNLRSFTKQLKAYQIDWHEIKNRN